MFSLLLSAPSYSLQSAFCLDPSPGKSSPPNIFNMEDLPWPCKPTSAINLDLSFHRLNENLNYHIYPHGQKIKLPIAL